MGIHEQLYNFWFCSKGVWDSKLVKVTVSLLDEQELLAIGKLHLLKELVFGVKTSWEYKIRDESGHMSWGADPSQPGLLFIDKGLKDTRPRICSYQMVGEHKMVITVGKLEETFLLETESRRLRELRCEGKLLRRLWEKKIAT